MMDGLTIEQRIDFTSRRPRRNPRTQELPSVSRIPRVSRLMALALKIDGLVQSGQIRDYAEVARVGQVSRARISQLLRLLDLSPTIIEDVLFLPEVIRGRDQITERDLRPIAAELDWAKQLTMWVTHRGWAEASQRSQWQAQSHYTESVRDWNRG